MNAQALQQLLKTRRALIAPEDHGLPRPTGAGRRAPGLSQEQVGTLIGWPWRTYHRLESGHYTDPPPPVDLLRDVARLYRMNEQEWVALCRYARGEDPPSPLHGDSGHIVPGAWQAALDGISHIAYVTDSAWNILAANAACHAFFTGGQAPRNIMRWMAIDGRAQLPDWETGWAPLALPQLRAALAQRPADPQLLALEAEVTADPIAGPLYKAGGVSIHPDGDERPARHAVLGDGWVTMCAGQPLASPGARFIIAIFHPGPHRPQVRPRTLTANP